MHVNMSESEYSFQNTYIMHIILLMNNCELIIRKLGKCV